MDRNLRLGLNENPVFSEVSGSDYDFTIWQRQQIAAKAETQGHSEGEIGCSAVSYTHDLLVSPVSTEVNDNTFKSFLQ